MMRNRQEHGRTGIEISSAPAVLPGPGHATATTAKKGCGGGEEVQQRRKLKASFRGLLSPAAGLATNPLIPRVPSAAPLQPYSTVCKDSCMKGFMFWSWRSGPGPEIQ